MDEIDKEEQETFMKRVNEFIRVQSEKENDEKLAEVLKTQDVVQICSFLEQFCVKNKIKCRIVPWRSSRGRQIKVEVRPFNDLVIWMKIKFNPDPYFYIDARFWFFHQMTSFPENYSNWCSFIRNMTENPIPISAVYKDLTRINNFIESSDTIKFQSRSVKLKCNDNKTYDGVIVAHDYLWLGQEEKSVQKHYVLHTDNGIKFFSENDVLEIV